VQVQALASTSAKSEGIMLIGVEPLAERAVTFIDQMVVQGQALAPGADREIMIGRKLAEKLRLRLGEKMVVMAQAADGELGTAAYRVSGIFATESASFDGAFAFVTLSAAQSLLALGSRVSTISTCGSTIARAPPGQSTVSMPTSVCAAWHSRRGRSCCLSLMTW
jgi:ABC-type lipoprotein release transport system permease subunit